MTALYESHGQHVRVVAKSFVKALPPGSIIELEGLFPSGGGWSSGLLVKHDDGLWHDSVRAGSRKGRKAGELMPTSTVTVVIRYVRVPKPEGLQS